jgi:hypothetical protein
MPDEPPPPSRSRRRALEALDALVAQAEEETRARRSVVERLIAAREDPRAALGLLRVAEARLARLRESRRVLLQGDGSDGKRSTEASRRKRRRGVSGEG